MTSLRQLPDCWQGRAPSAIATVSPDGVPNVSYVSQIHLVDDDHVAVSNQFLNKTRANLDASPHATALVLDPTDGAQYVLEMEFVRRDIDGPLFDELATSIDAIAGMVGMQSVFRLRSAEVFRVQRIVRVHGG